MHKQTALHDHHPVSLLAGVADYSGSNVKQLLLRELELLHRLSFGHRNQRSYLVVLYKPDSPACQAFEAEVRSLLLGPYTCRLYTSS
jgi:hypothetical protein